MTWREDSLLRNLVLIFGLQTLVNPLYSPECPYNYQHPDYRCKEVHSWMMTLVKDITIVDLQDLFKNPKLQKLINIGLIRSHSAIIHKVFFYQFIFHDLDLFNFCSLTWLKLWQEVLYLKIEHLAITKNLNNLKQGKLLYLRPLYTLEFYKKLVVDAAQRYRVSVF